MHRSEVGAMIEPRTPGAAEFVAGRRSDRRRVIVGPEGWGYYALTGLAYVAAETSSIKPGTFAL